MTTREAETALQNIEASGSAASFDQLRTYLQLVSSDRTCMRTLTMSGGVTGAEVSLCRDADARAQASRLGERCKIWLAVFAKIS